MQQVACRQTPSVQNSQPVCAAPLTSDSKRLPEMGVFPLEDERSEYSRLSNQTGAAALSHYTINHSVHTA